MLLPQQVCPSYLESFVNILKTPTRPKHIRLSAFIICVNQFIIATFLLFVFILAFIHIEEANSRAIADMKDQFGNAFYTMPDLEINRVRFHFAIDISITSRTFTYVLVCGSSLYLLTVIGLIIGIYKSREELILLWLIFQIVPIIAWIVFSVWFADAEFVKKIISKVWIYLMSTIVLFTGVFKWCIIYSFYYNVRLMNKLREIATVAIPCPAPGTVPFHFRRENMYLGSNGYKHILTEAPDGNY